MVCGSFALGYYFSPYESTMQCLVERWIFGGQGLQRCLGYLTIQEAIVCLCNKPKSDKAWDSRGIDIISSIKSLSFNQTGLTRARIKYRSYFFSAREASSCALVNYKTNIYSLILIDEPGSAATIHAAFPHRQPNRSHCTIIPGNGPVLIRIVSLPS